MNLGTRTWGTALAAAIIAIGAGCGSSSKGGGGSFTTSVPSSTKLTSLTPSQATQLCNDLNAYAQGTLSSVLCKELGVEAAVFLQAFQGAATDAELQMTCQQAYEGCLHPDGGATTTGGCDSTTFSNEPSTCQATVGDVQTCLNDQTAAYQQASATIPSCSSLTASSVASLVSSATDGGTTNVAQPASCSKFDSTCNQMAM